MITVIYYKNGFKVNGHARPDICGEVSIFGWALSNVIMNISDGEYYTSDQDNSNAGYTHLVFNADNERAVEVFQLTKKMLPIWADHRSWQTDGHVKIIEKDETLVIPDNFKELNGIAV